MRTIAILAGAGVLSLALIFDVTSVFGTGLSINLPAYGQNGFKVDLKALPKTEQHVARRRINIIETAPIVTDNRDTPQQETVILNLGSPPAAQKRTYVINAGGGPDGQPGTTNGGTSSITLDLTRPPKAGFTTNIPARGLTPANPLADGRSTNRLGNSYKAAGQASGRMNAPQTVPPQGALLQRVESAKEKSVAAPVTMKYPTVSSGTSTTNRRTSADVAGRIVRRGDYLKPVK